MHSSSFGFLMRSLKNQLLYHSRASGIPEMPEKCWIPA